MNFLAHIYLSGDDTDLMIGNFIADFIRGKKYLEKYPPSILKGITLHRKIDAFTDAHPQIRLGVERMSAYHGRYATVVVDVFYDYLLIANWEKLSHHNLQDYAIQTYDKLERNINLMPGRLKKMLPRMIQNNWLLSYGNKDGLDFTFSKMEKRTSFTSNFESATTYLLKNEDLFLEEFNIFFPDLVAFVEQEKKLL